MTLDRLIRVGILVALCAAAMAVGLAADATARSSRPSSGAIVSPAPAPASSYRAELPRTGGMLPLGTLVFLAVGGVALIGIGVALWPRPPRRGA